LTAVLIKDNRSNLDVYEGSEHNFQTSSWFWIYIKQK